MKNSFSLIIVFALLLTSMTALSAPKKGSKKGKARATQSRKYEAKKKVNTPKKAIKKVTKKKVITDDEE